MSVVSVRSGGSLGFAKTDYVSVRQAAAKCRPRWGTGTSFSCSSFFLEPKLGFRRGRANPKDRSNLMATAKSPVSFGCSEEPCRERSKEVAGPGRGRNSNR